MDDEKVEKLSLYYCRFCGAYNVDGGNLKHRRRCRKASIGVIDHVPELRAWCAVWERSFDIEVKEHGCPYCGGRGLVERYL